MLRAYCACLAVAAVLFVAGMPVVLAQAPEAPARAGPPPTEQPPAAQAPVPVQVVPSPKTEAQLDAERREHDERQALIDQLSLYGGLLVGVAVLLALAFVVQALYLGWGLRSIRRMAQSADRNLMSVQRAFVYIRSLDWSTTDANLIISPIWANAGTTPTRSLRISTNWKASHGELAADFAFTYVRPPEQRFLGPNGSAEVGTIFIPMRDVQAAIEERVFLYVWGRATYADIFEGSNPHFYDFCHRLEVGGIVPNNITLAFAQHGPRNGTDEDRPLHEPVS
jgi:hypothetical protein